MYNNGCFSDGLVNDVFCTMMGLPKRVIEKIKSNIVPELYKRKISKETYNKSTTKIPSKLVQKKRKTIQIIYQ